MYKVSKKVISNLTKCYSIAPIEVEGKHHFLVAAEKVDRCILFDMDGNEKETVWNEPGGVMTMVPIRDGQFLATHRFYSPNDSKEAKIVIVTRRDKDDWEVRTLVDLPYVHRFDVLEAKGEYYLIACCIKSNYEYRDDWRFPGRTFAAKLPKDLDFSQYDQDHQLEMTVIKDNMLKNHGYYRTDFDGVQGCLVCCDDGVYTFIPPQSDKETWSIERLIDVAASDAVLVDLDQDGERELCVLSPFHGNDLYIYKLDGSEYKQVYKHPQSCEFLHALYGGDLCGSSAFVVGHRKGQRDLLIITYDQDKKEYVTQIVDHDCGPANVAHFTVHGKDVIVSTNREIDEVAYYTVEKV